MRPGPLGRVAHGQARITQPAAGLLILPHAEGPPLRELLRPPGMPAARARALLSFLLSGLVAAHERGLVHGSLLPAQIVCDAAGRPLLGPFGADEIAGLVATRTGALEELLTITAPELRGGGAPTAASDVYGAAALFVALRTGQAYYSYWEKQGILRVAQERVELARSLERTSYRRLSVGEISQNQHMRAQLELARAQADMVLLGEELTLPAVTTWWCGQHGPLEEVLKTPEKFILQQAFHPERRPVALGVLDQLVRLRHPHRPSTALKPVVQQDAGDLTALAGAGAVAQHPTPPEAHGVLGSIRRGRHDVESLVDHPRSGEMPEVRFAGIDDALELRIGQQALGDDIGRQAWPIARLRRCDGRHRRRLHQPCRMGLRTDNPDRLQLVSFVQRLGKAAALGRLPVHGLVGKLRTHSLKRFTGNGARLPGGLPTRHDRDRRDRWGKRGAMKRQAWRNMGRHPLKQRRDIRCHAR